MRCGRGRADPRGLSLAGCGGSDGSDRPDARAHALVGRRARRRLSRVSPRCGPSCSPPALNRPWTCRLPATARGFSWWSSKGRIRLLRGRTVVATPFLDITDRVGSSGSEQGLLGLAFHPRFAENGRFFVNYTDRSGDTHIAEFRAAAGADTVDPATERTLFVQDQPFANHNGGQLAFGPDGFLYIGLGDGGSGGDPFEQRPEPRDPARQAAAHRRGRRPALRRPRGQPLRVAFRRAARGLGLRPAQPLALRLRPHDGRPPHRRRGPERRRGDRCASRRRDEAGRTTAGTSPRGAAASAPPPAARGTGSRSPWSSTPTPRAAPITGGVVYRGCRMPGYAGTYFYGDFCSGFVRSFRLQGGQAVDQRDWTSQLGRAEQPLGVRRGRGRRGLRPGAGRQHLPDRPRGLNFGPTRAVGISDESCPPFLHPGRL